MLGLSALWKLRYSPLDYYASLQQRQGDCATVRVGPYRLRFFFHPREIEAVLTTGATEFVRLERVMRILSQWNGRSLLLLEGQDWRARRRRVLPAFARARMEDYARRSVENAARLRVDWASRGSHGAVDVDTDQEMARLALNIALDSLFGAQADASRDEIAAAVKVFSYVAYSESSGAPRTPSWWPLGIGPRKAQAIRSVDRLVRGMIDARGRGEAHDKDDLLAILLSGDPVEARDDAVSLLIAGHETTGAALSWLSHLLAASPKALAAARQEIEAVLRGRLPGIEDFARLTFLRAAVAETLRLYPPAYGLFPRRAVNDLKVGSAHVRRNDVVLLVPYITQRDPRWFPDPELFLPERFLAEPTWPDYSYFPFGAGPRVCIGQQFGLVEMTLAMATLLQKFTPLATDVSPRPEARFSLRPKGGLPQRWTLL